MVSCQKDQDSDAWSGDVQRFSAFLEKSGLSRLVIEQTTDHAIVAFTGPFEGREVVWRCEFVTLATELQRLVQEDSPSPGGLRNFIEISDPQVSGVPIRVGLALPRVDPAAIDKMILMVRLYKNLRRGRHEYGEVCS